MASVSNALIHAIVNGNMPDAERHILSGANINQVSSRIFVARPIQTDEELQKTITVTPKYLVRRICNAYGTHKLRVFLKYQVLIPSGATPLYVAAQIVHHVGLTALLLKHGANIPEEISEDGKRVIEMAKRSRYS